MHNILSTGGSSDLFISNAQCFNTQYSVFQCFISARCAMLRLKYIMLLKLSIKAIILSRNSFKLFPTLYYKSMQMCYKNHNTHTIIILISHLMYNKSFLPYVLSWIQEIFDCGFEIMEASRNALQQ